MITTKMAVCEFYASIYAESVQNPKIKSSIEIALPEFYASVLVFSMKAKEYFESEGIQKFANVLKPFSIFFKPFLDDIEKSEAKVKEFADMATMEKISGMFPLGCLCSTPYIS